VSHRESVRDDNVTFIKHNPFPRAHSVPYACCERLSLAKRHHGRHLSVSGSLQSSITGLPSHHSAGRDRHLTELSGSNAEVLIGSKSPIWRTAELGKLHPTALHGALYNTLDWTGGRHAETRAIRDPLLNA
jgi:hypothetical protein